MSNGYGDHSIGKYSLTTALITEVTMLFLFIILGATDKRSPQSFAPIAIGLGLPLIQLISIPVTQTSVNPPATRALPSLSVIG
jgi:aquaporin Z